MRISDSMLLHKCLIIKNRKEVELQRYAYSNNKYTEVIQYY